MNNSSRIVPEISWADKLKAWEALGESMESIDIGSIIVLKNTICVPVRDIEAINEHIRNS